jgi:DNA-directed RNA polymerase subunit N (RpoN/RPB10)
VEAKYKLLGEEKVETVTDKDKDATLSGMGVVPFICERMDLSFQQKLGELNFGQR